MRKNLTRYYILAGLVIIILLQVLCWHEKDTRAELRKKMRQILSFPSERIDIKSYSHGRIERPSYVIEKISYAAESGSRVTANLYLPRSKGKYKYPAVIIAGGHGQSKSSPTLQFTGKLFAFLGIASLSIDTIGEEERQKNKRLGARQHDKEEQVIHKELKRFVVGKIIWDLIRGIDFLQSRPDIDPLRIGIVGSSLGGYTAGIVAQIDQRISAVVVSSWAFREFYTKKGSAKNCVRKPYSAFSEIMSFSEMIALAAPHSAMLIYNGDTDEILDRYEKGKGLVRDVSEGLKAAQKFIYKKEYPRPIEFRFVEGGGDIGLTTSDPMLYSGW